jgi:hypothetical protein
MKNIIIVLLSLTSLSSYAMTCKKDGVTLEIDKNDVTITFEGNSIRNVINDSVWDGHIGGIMTGRGLAIIYENHYGCFRNVKYTGRTSALRQNIGTIDFGTCAGGSTSDRVCLNTGFNIPE